MKTPQTKPSKPATIKTYKSPVDRLKAGGLDVIRGVDGFRAALSAITFAPAEHLLAHPRQFLPLDPDMVQDIAMNGVTKEIVVYEIVLDEVADSGEYRRELYIVNGARRVNHAIAAEKLNRKSGVLSGDECMRLKFRLYEGTVVEALMEQLKDNADPLKVADSVGVLAVMIGKLIKLGVTEAAIEAKAPKGVGPAEVSALVQWAKVIPEVQARFDSGEAPIGLLPAIVSVPGSKQMETLDKLLGAKVKTSKGATRALRKSGAKKSGGTGERLHPRRVAKVVASIMASPVAPGSPTDWFLRGIALVEGKLNLSELPPVLRGQVLAALPAYVRVEAE